MDFSEVFDGGIDCWQSEQSKNVNKGSILMEIIKNTAMMALEWQKIRPFPIFLPKVMTSTRSGGMKYP
jgi:hypothetical protein